MMRYRLKKLFVTAAIAVPAPAALARICRLYHEARAGENFGDMTINGELRFLRDQAQDCRVLFDVGAHHGEWTRHAIEATTDAHIHCFEPLAAHYRKLRESCPRGGAVCNDFGLSDASRRDLIGIESGSLHRRGEGARHAVEEVRLRTLDEYCRERAIQRIDFLKIDVEGHELAVLRGAEEMIRNGRVARIQFEYGPYNADSRVLLHELFSFLEPLDYDLYKILPRRLLRVRYDRGLENLQYKNFAALHHSLRP